MDFIEPTFDNPAVYTGPASEVMILSTPSSGASPVCSLLHQNSIGIPHAYFQPYQYLPALARRVGIKHIDEDNLHRITAFLRTRRARGGWFSYNIHAAHRGSWHAFRPSLEAAGMMDGSVLLYCTRADLAAQTAASYIAHRVQSWGTLGLAEDEAQSLNTFDEDLAIRICRSLVDQERAARAIFETERRRFHRVRILRYEDTWTDRLSTIAEVLPIHDSVASSERVDPGLQSKVIHQMRKSSTLRELVIAA